jgi:hypothetical protein
MNAVHNLERFTLVKFAASSIWTPRSAGVRGYRVQFSDTDVKEDSACLSGQNGHVDSARDKKEEGRRKTRERNKVRKKVWMKEEEETRLWKRVTQCTAFLNVVRPERMQ